MNKDNLSVTDLSARNRIPWIDNLRALGIFWVVFIHTGRVSSPVYVYASSFFMPLFFFISGLLVKDSIKKELFLSWFKKQTYRLLTPYITFNVISFSLWFFMLRHFGHHAELNVPPFKAFLGIFYGIGGDGWLAHNVVLWFFPCLLMTKTIFFFLIRIRSRMILVVALFFLSVSGYLFFCFFPEGIFRLPFGMDIAVTAVVFYGIGYLCRAVCSENITKTKQYMTVIIAFAANIVFSMLNGPTAFITGNYGNYFYFYLGALSGIIFWLYIARLIKPNLLLSRVGQNTLIIFPLHLMVFPFITGFLVYGFKIPKTALDTSNTVAFSYTIAAIIILMPVARLLNTYAPVIIGKKHPGFLGKRIY